MLFARLTAVMEGGGECCLDARVVGSRVGGACNETWGHRTLCPRGYGDLGLRSDNSELWWRSTCCSSESPCRRWCRC